MAAQIEAHLPAGHLTKAAGKGVAAGGLMEKFVGGKNHD
jgi:hypothetical protein